MIQSRRYESLLLRKIDFLLSWKNTPKQRLDHASVDVYVFTIYVYFIVCNL